MMSTVGVEPVSFNMHFIVIEEIEALCEHIAEKLMFLPQ